MTGMLVNLSKVFHMGKNRKMFREQGNVDCIGTPTTANIALHGFYCNDTHAHTKNSEDQHQLRNKNELKLSWSGTLIISINLKTYSTNKAK